MLENNFSYVKYEIYGENDDGETVLLRNASAYFESKGQVTRPHIILEQELSPGQNVTFVIRVTMIGSATPGAHHAFLINPTEKQKTTSLLNNDFARVYPIDEGGE